MWRLNFTDGTYINILEGDTIPPYDSVGFTDCLFVLKDGEHIETAWTGTKTDLSGNTWEITDQVSGSWIVRFHRPNETTWYNASLGTYRIGGIALVKNDTTTDTFNFGTYGRHDETYRGGLYVNGANGSDLNFGQYISEYPDNIAYNMLNGRAMVWYSGQRGGLWGFGGTIIPIEWFTDAIQVITDPYDPGGPSGPGGGTGTFSDTGDDVDIPAVPTLSSTETGFITLFNPSASELRALASYMWSNPLFDLDAWKKIFADPMDAILGLSIVPVAVPNGGQATVTVGNISTGVSMNKAAAQYVEVDCGTLNVQEYWGAYLDYDPYTKAEIYLPYIGTHPLAVDDIMGKPVHVVYHVDILSGACCAYVKCGGSILYTFTGQCSSSIPITGNDWTNVINGAISIAASIGTMVATGGASAPVGVSAIASTAVNQMKPTVEKSGAMGSTGGMLGVQTPYLILTRPRQAVPTSQNVYTGYPSFITSRLGDLSGFTIVSDIHLDGIPATGDEMTEIESLLKSGVLL